MKASYPNPRGADGDGFGAIALPRSRSPKRSAIEVDLLADCKGTLDATESRCGTVEFPLLATGRGGGFSCGGNGNGVEFNIASRLVICSAGLVSSSDSRSTVPAFAFVGKAGTSARKLKSSWLSSKSLLLTSTEAVTVFGRRNLPRNRPTAEGAGSTAPRSCSDGICDSAACIGGGVDRLEVGIDASCMPILLWLSLAVPVGFGLRPFTSKRPPPDVVSGTIGVDAFRPQRLHLGRRPSASRPRAEAVWRDGSSPPDSPKRDRACQASWSS